MLLPPASWASSRNQWLGKVSGPMAYTALPITPDLIRYGSRSPLCVSFPLTTTGATISLSVTYRKQASRKIRILKAHFIKPFNLWISNNPSLNHFVHLKISQKFKQQTTLTYLLKSGIADILI